MVNLERYVGKVILVKIPGTKIPVYRWVVKKREDGRYIVRAPKMGVAIKTLKELKNSDYGKEQLLHKDAKKYTIPKTRAQNKGVKKNKTHKNKK